MFAVIMAGGSGTRFWPASREDLPKQFLKITSDKTMVEETAERSRRFSRLEKIFTVVGRNHAGITQKLLAGTEITNIIEPCARNTSACIGLAALHAGRISQDEPMVVLPADHFIADVEAFAGTVGAAVEIARSGAIITIGIAPTRPETGYGYIQTAGEQGRSSGMPYYAVERFVEKPDQVTALKYLTQGNFLWNSGIFVFTARTILTELKTHLPELYDGLMEIEKSIGGPDYEAVLDRVYGDLPAISIDYSVMEKTAKPIYVFRADFGWSDVGSWQALYELRSGEYDEKGNLLLGETMVVDSDRNLVYSNAGRKVALLGVEGLVVVDTPDAVMVADIRRSQDVKRFTEMMKMEK